MNPRAFRSLVLAACVIGVAGCSGSPKPCPVATEAQYAAALVKACADAGSLEDCKAYPAIKAAHQLKQEDAGCRVK